MNKKMKKEKHQHDAIETFRETAKGGGKIRLHPHEAYEEELEKRLE